MPRIDIMFECANYNFKAQNLNQTCVMGNVFNRCKLLEDNYNCYNYKKKGDTNECKGCS